jgi:hypothetical protein
VRIPLLVSQGEGQPRHRDETRLCAIVHDVRGESFTEEQVTSMSRDTIGTRSLWGRRSHGTVEASKGVSQVVVTETTREWTRNELVDVLEKQVWTRCGISAAELVRSYREGALEDSGSVADLLALAYLLPADDPLSIRG